MSRFRLRGSRRLRSVASGNPSTHPVLDFALQPKDSKTKWHPFRKPVFVFKPLDLCRA